MKRFLNALKSDVKFQFKQGFYYVYIVITLLYLIIIFQLGQKAQKIVTPLIIFSDPSILGFMFIGGIILLEKQQGILDYITITPISIKEYIWAKVVSLTMLSLIVGLVIATSVGIEYNVLLLIVGIILSASVFTIAGIYAVSGCQSINQYFAVMVPYMLILVLPAIGFIKYKFLNIFPVCAGLSLVFGAYNGIEIMNVIYSIIYLIIWNIIFYILTIKKFEKKVVFGE